MGKPQVYVKKLHPSAVLPSYAALGDAGADMTSVENKVLLPGESAMISTGIAIQLPDGYEAQVRPRSGLAYKKQVTVINSPGTIDEGYRGPCNVLLINHGNEEFVVSEGDRIAQMVIKPVEQANFIEIDELTDTSRGEGGFGSTGT
jgi:dUTP pyrophosphatase